MDEDHRRRKAAMLTLFRANRAEIVAALGDIQKKGGVLPRDMAFRLQEERMIRSVPAVRELEEADPLHLPVLLGADLEAFLEVLGEELPEVAQARRRPRSAMDEMMERWAPMSAVLQEERKGPVVILTGGIHTRPKTWSGEGLGYDTAIYVIQTDREDAIVCPFELPPFESGGKMSDVDVQLVGMDNPLALSLGSKALIRPWLAQKVAKATIIHHAAARLTPELHQRVLQAIERASDDQTRPPLNSAWERAWRHGYPH